MSRGRRRPFVRQTKSHFMYSRVISDFRRKRVGRRWGNRPYVRFHAVEGVPRTVRYGISGSRRVCQAKRKKKQLLLNENVITVAVDNPILCYWCLSTCSSSVVKPYGTCAHIHSSIIGTRVMVVRARKKHLSFVLLSVIRDMWNRTCMTK